MTNQREVCGDNCCYMGKGCYYSDPEGFVAVKHCFYYESDIYKQIRENNERQGNPVWNGGYGGYNG